MFIAALAIVVGCAIPITAIVTAHMRSTKKLHIQQLDREIELERLRLETFDKETAKLTLELEQSRQLLLEERK